MSMKKTPKYQFDVQVREGLPCCKDAYCDEITHQVKVTLFINGKKVFAEKEIKEVA